MQDAPNSLSQLPSPADVAIGNLADGSSTPPASPSTASPPTPPTPPIDVFESDDPALLRDVVRQLLAINTKLRQEHDALKHQFDQPKRRLFGPKSEKFDPNQPLLFPEMQTNASADTAAENAAAENVGAEAAKPEPAPESPTSVAGPDAAPKKGHGRKGLNPKLRREERVHDVPDGQRCCPSCKVDCVPFGDDVREQLDYAPASLFVVRHVCRKYACPKCHDYVAGASRPDSPIERGLPGPGLLAQVVVSKYADHLPLHRLERIFGRHGVELSRSTMSDWMKAVAELARPLYERMIEEVLLSRVLHTDDTKVPWQNPESPGKTQSARMWCYLGDRIHPFDVFHFTPTWSRDGPRKFLEGFRGMVQADSLSGYDTICDELKIVRVACWAHARRYFVEARDSDPARAAEGLARIARLYAVEKEAAERIAKEKLQGDAADAVRLDLRRATSIAELTALRHWLETLQKDALPKSPIGKAVAYALNHWDALNRYVQQGWLSIDNNAAERALRPIALGRNNWLFVGSQTGGETAAILFSLTSSCRRNGIDPFAYLRDVFARLTELRGRPADPQAIASLLPHRWTPPST